MQQTKAIVLNHIKYAESSIIVKLYTEQQGLISCIVKGIRGKKGKLRTGLFQPLNLLDINYKTSTRSKLMTLSEVKIAEPFSDLLFNPIKRSVALFISELLQNSIREEECNLALFNFIYNTIHLLDLNTKSSTHFHIVFMMKLTKYLGFYPLRMNENVNYFDLEKGCFTSSKPMHFNYLNNEIMNAWNSLLLCDFNSIEHLTFSNTLKRSLVQALMTYYKLHLIHFKELNSHQILQLVFDND